MFTQTQTCQKRTPQKTVYITVSPEAYSPTNFIVSGRVCNRLIRGRTPQECAKSELALDKIECANCQCARYKTEAAEGITLERTADIRLTSRKRGEFIIYVQFVCRSCQICRCQNI